MESLGSKADEREPGTGHDMMEGLSPTGCLTTITITKDRDHSLAQKPPWPHTSTVTTIQSQAYTALVIMEFYI